MACENWNQRVTTEDELGKREKQDKDELIHLVQAEKEKKKEKEKGILMVHSISLNLNVTSKIASHFIRVPLSC